MSFKSSVQNFFKSLFPKYIIEQFTPAEYEKLQGQVTSLTAELEEQKGHYHKLMRLSTDGILVTSVDGKLLEYSERMKTMLGYSEEEMQTLYIHDWEPSNTKEEIAEIIQSLTHEPIEFESLHTRKDGTTYPAHITAVKIKFKDQDVLYASVRDISTQKQKEKSRIRQQEENRALSLRMELALKVSQIGIWEWDYTKQILYWDENMYKIYGVEIQDEPLVKNKQLSYDAWSSALEPSEKVRIEAVMADAIKNNKEFNTTFWITSPLGEKRYIQTIGTGELNSEGIVEKLIGVNIDITQQNATETYLNGRITDEINRRLEKEQEFIHQSRQAAMGEMISMIAHQWRQPITTIKTIMSKIALKKEMDMLSDEDLLSDVKKTSEITLKLSRTIETFQQFFKKKEGAYTELCDLLGNVNQIVSPIFDAANIAHVIESEDKSIIVDDRLDQVFLNLYQNASDVLKEQESDFKKNVTTKINQNSLGEIVILIFDNGGGIDDEIIDRIFVPYFSTKAKNGTGLGLYICKTIIEEQIGGKISVYNTYDGACFEIVLPPPPAFAMPKK